MITFINKEDYNKKYYSLNKEREKLRTKKYVIENKDKVTEARKIWWTKKGKQYRLDNIERIRKSAREYAKRDRLKNPEKYKAYHKSETYKECHKRYKLRHPDRITKANVKYAKHRISVDTNYRLRWLLRSRINIAIKRQLGSKCLKSMELLGCTIEQAREHLEKQFVNGMSWENHGKLWEIDHIIPVSRFDLTKPDEQKKCFHYTNLQPLDWKENRRKSNRIVI